MRPAVFLDRDGVLNESEVRDGKPYAPRLATEFRLYPEAARDVQQLRDAGYLVIVVTNQPDVGNGLADQAEIEAMHAQLRAAVPVDGIEVCYASQKDNSPRRKPAPGMLFDAAQTWDIDLAASTIIGDRWSDIEAGKAAGCRTIFIDRQYNATERERVHAPDVTVSSLTAAVQNIID